jgi:hypothetical protein
MSPEEGNLFNRYYAWSTDTCRTPFIGGMPLAAAEVFWIVEACAVVRRSLGSGWMANMLSA